RRAVGSARYPPAGVRGIGAERATGWGQCVAQHVREADDNVLMVPIIESVRGGQNIEELCQVPGVEVFQLGPADYSASAGYPGQWEGPGVTEQLLAVKDAVRRHGKHCGILATSDENLLLRRRQGFTMLGVGVDAALLRRALRGALGAGGRDRPVVPSLAPVPLREAPAADEGRELDEPPME